MRLKPSSFWAEENTLRHLDVCKETTAISHRHDRRPITTHNSLTPEPTAAVTNLTLPPPPLLLGLQAPPLYC